MYFKIVDINQNVCRVVRIIMNFYIIRCLGKFLKYLINIELQKECE